MHRIMCSFMRECMSMQWMNIRLTQTNCIVERRAHFLFPNFRISTFQSHHTLPLFRSLFPPHRWWYEYFPRHRQRIFPHKLLSTSTFFNYLVLFEPQTQTHTRKKKNKFNHTHSSERWWVERKCFTWDINQKYTKHLHWQLLSPMQYVLSIG